MTELKGPPSDIKFTVTVKRAATGIEETYNMVGRVVPDEPTVTNEQPKEKNDVSHA